MSRRTFHIPDTTRTELTQQAPDTTANFALQYQTQVVEQTKAKQQDEMELLSLQRELRIRNREYVAIQSKYDQLFNHFKNIRDNHKTLLTHLEELKQQIEEERQKNMDLNNELQLSMIENSKIHDAKLKNEEQAKEIQLLKEVNKNLERTLLDDKKGVELRNEKKYKQHIEGLEAEIKKWNETGKKQYADNTQLLAKLQLAESKTENLTKDNFALANKSATLEEKLRKLEKQLELNQLVTDSLKKKKEIKNTADQQIQTDPYEPPTVIRKISQPIIPQRAISPRQEEILSPKTPMKSDIQFTKEKNMCELTIGTLKVKTGSFPYDNLMPLFVSVDFFEHETQATHIVTPGASPSLYFNDSFMFEVVLNDLFLYYLQNCDLVLELNMANGQEYELIGSAKVPLKELLTSQDEISGFAVITNKNTSIATINYMLKMETPVTKCIRQDVDKLNKFLSKLAPKTTESDNTEAQQIMIRILQCSEIPVRKDVPFHIQYKLHTFNLYRTKTLKAGDHGDVVVNDEQIFPVHNNLSLQRYLSKEKLHVGVVESSDRVIGTLDIPLRELLNSESIVDNFQLDNGGTISIEINRTKN